MNLDDFLIQNGVKNININEDHDHIVMRNITITFIDDREYGIKCHEDNIEMMIRQVVSEKGILALRKKKIDKITEKCIT